jgi:parallel beta-helix repeat protein
MRFLKHSAMVIAALAFCVGLAIPAAAAPVTSLTSCQPITASGMYRLDADVTSAPGTDCFGITAKRVTLILNGHTITSGGSTTIGILATGANDNIVGPGTVTGFFVGVNMASQAVALDGVDESVRGVTVATNDEGIFIGGSGNSIRGNTITGSRVGGIFAGFVASDNTIIGNYSHNPPGSIDLLDFITNCDSNVWRGNDFTTSVQSCIH